jgi:hypothetical protein
MVVTPDAVDEGAGGPGWGGGGGARGGFCTGGGVQRRGSGTNLALLRRAAIAGHVGRRLGFVCALRKAPAQGCHRGLRPEVTPRYCRQQWDGREL